MSEHFETNSVLPAGCVEEGRAVAAFIIMGIPAGMVEGTVAETSTEKMVKETKPGTNITRNGTEDNPAVYIEREGNNVVKKQSELYKVHDDS